mgnify:CR=1 FL=1|jgi:2-polyprenyl-3-methyl-5-hydroxy-6-metoxy-1,4-benzoquinol methylase
MTAGIEGYERNISQFIESCQALDFEIVCKDFVEFLPLEKSSVLDVGSGAGQNAVALDKLGFDVTAIEPMHDFRCAAQTTYEGASVKWLAGSLPKLTCLGSGVEKFDFVLIEGVWHHLNEIEREQAAARISRIVKPNGKVSISLRNGPAGLGSRVYPTDTERTIRLFENHSFECIFSLENIDSILPNKEGVKWSRIVLQK